jgi:hypothetical protein
MEINWNQAVVTSSKYYSEIFMEVLRKTMRRFNHNIRYSNRDSNRVSRAHKSKFIIAETWSVRVFCYLLWDWIFSRKYAALLIYFYWCVGCVLQGKKKTAHNLWQIIAKFVNINAKFLSYSNLFFNTCVLCQKDMNFFPLKYSGFNIYIYIYIY